MNEATWRFVRRHATDDVRQVALRGTGEADVDLPRALQQIQGWQAARTKLPTWAATQGIVYPPHLNMEQCSSEATARYKAQVARSLSPLTSHHSPLFVDLTGGLGVDFAFMSQAFGEAIYVERDAQLCQLARQNFHTLGLDHAQVVCADAEDYLHRMERRAALIFLDPARRDGHGARTYGIGDCTPNILPLLDELLAKSARVMVKLSPMLDWRKAVSDLGPERVEQVHIVAVGGECKELLLISSPIPPLGGLPAPHSQLFCVNDDTIETFTLPLQTRKYPQVEAPAGRGWGGYLYEPNAALMKAGLFGELALRYGVSQLAANSHLFMSERLVEGFPGRTFRIGAVSTMNKRELREKVLPLGQANITVRNFPLSVAELRRRLKMGEGGGNYLFATTLASGEHVLIVCNRL